ncbi:MAG: hypothetical protein HGA78_05170 [Nitrospirales bacterium]|nr:hypothetical protein [Nitrospirales bacterium]
MDDVKYKEYSPEEDRIYDEAMEKIRHGLSNGLSFDEACAAAEVKDEELKAFIIDDALKVMIAENHYQKGIPLADLAETLKVPLRRINKAHSEMLEDAGITAAKMFRAESEGGSVGNA